MFYMEEFANQREREVAARTRSPLFTQQATGGPFRPVRSRRKGGGVQHERSERGRAGLPALSLGKWRHWSAKPDRVHCSRAAAVSGAC